MNVYLVEFYEHLSITAIRVIIGTSSEEECKKYCEDKFGCQFDKPHLKTYAHITDSCDVMRDKITYVEFEFEE